MTTRQVDEIAGGLLEARRRTQHQAALETGRRHCDAPAGTFVAETILDRHTHVIEEDFGEARQTVELLDRPDRDARQIQRHQNKREYVVTASFGIGAINDKQPLSPDRARRPGSTATATILLLATQALAAQ